MKTIDKTIMWKDTKETQEVTFGVGENLLGDSDDSIFYWVDEEIELNNIFEEFIIL